MTVGIAVVFPGGVVAIADGRTSKVFEDEVVSEATQKIIQTHPGTSVIVFGVTDVTQSAISLMKRSDPPPAGVEAIALASASLGEAWSAFVPRLAADVDKTSASLRAAIVVAGVDRHGPYVGATMMSFDGPQQVGPVYGLYNHIVIGGEKYGSPSTFVNELNTALATIAPTDHPIAVGNRMIDAAAKTINAVALHDRTVGGRIHYRLQLTGGEAIDAHF